MFSLVKKTLLLAAAMENTEAIKIRRAEPVLSVMCGWTLPACCGVLCGVSIIAVNEGWCCPKEPQPLTYDSEEPHEIRVHQNLKSVGMNNRSIANQGRQGTPDHQASQPLNFLAMRAPARPQ